MSLMNIQFSSAAMWTLRRLPSATSSIVSTIAPIIAKTLYTTGFVMYHTSKMIPPALSWMWWASKKAFVAARIAASCAVRVAIVAYSLYNNGGSNKIPASVEQIETEEEQKEEGVSLLKQVESLSAENEALKIALAQLKLENAQQNKRILEQQGQIEQVNQLVSTLQAELIESKKAAIVEAPAVNMIKSAEVEVEVEAAVESEPSSIPAPPPLPIIKKARSSSSSSSNNSNSEAYKAAAAVEVVVIKKAAVPSVTRPTIADLVSGRSMLKKQEMPAFTVSERKEANQHKQAEQNDLAAALLKGFAARKLNASYEEPEEEEDVEEEEF